MADFDDLTRDELPEQARAVADTLDEWLARMHGISSGGHHVGAFLEFLAKRGELEYEVHIANTPREGRSGWDNGYAWVETYEDLDEARGMAEHLAGVPGRPTRVVQRPVNPFPWMPVPDGEADHAS